MGSRDENVFFYSSGDGAVVPTPAPSSWAASIATTDGAARYDEQLSRDTYGTWGLDDGPLIQGGYAHSTTLPPQEDGSPSSAWSEATSSALQSMSGEEPRMIRVGIVSRHLFVHQVGLLVEGIVMELGKAGYIMEIFLIDGYIHNMSDPVFALIKEHAYAVHPVSAELPVVIRAIREAKVDVLLYPDLGLDPIPYFAAFARLAPIQLTGLGHADTSGLDTIDYFISDSNEIASPSAETHYTETLVRMSGMGTCFVDRYLEYATALQAPRTSLLERAKYIEAIGKEPLTNVYPCVPSAFT